MIGFIHRSIKQVLIRNLPFNVPVYQIIDAFEKVGVVKQYSLPLDEFDKAKGYAIVEYSDPSNCKVAVEKLDGKRIGSNYVKAILLEEDKPDDVIKRASFKPRKEYLKHEREIVDMRKIDFNHNR